MRIDIIGSILITLVLMLICHFFRLNLFESILLMIGCFVLFRYWHCIKIWWWRIKEKFSKKEVRKNIKSSFERMDLEKE